MAASVETHGTTRRTEEVGGRLYRDDGSATVAQHEVEESQRQQEWLELKRMEEEQEEMYQRALERELHAEKLSKEQEKLLTDGVRPDIEKAEEEVQAHAHLQQQKKCWPVFRQQGSEAWEQRMSEWEKLKRRQEEEEEEQMRIVEKNNACARKGSLEHDAAAGKTKKFRTSSLSAPGRSGGGNRPTLKSCTSREETDTLDEWEAIKRREEEEQERLLREMERMNVARKGSIETAKSVKSTRMRASSLSALGGSGGSLAGTSCLKPSDSWEEAAALEEWEALKRSESENEERLLREMEKENEMRKKHQERERVRRKKSERELRELEREIELRHLQQEKQKNMQGRPPLPPNRKKSGDAPAPAILPKPSSAPDLMLEEVASKIMLTQDGGDESEKLRDWEELKRHESELEEMMIREMEKELHRQRSQSLGGSPMRVSPQRDLCHHVDSESQREWEEMKRLQEESEEQMGREAERGFQRRRPGSFRGPPILNLTIEEE